MCMLTGTLQKPQHLGELQCISTSLRLTYL